MSFSQNVEIIENSLPKIIPVNKSCVQIDYQNSVVIKNFAYINKIEVKVRQSLTGNNFFTVASATRDESKKSSSYPFNKQTLTEGKLLAYMKPCEVYEGVKIIFYSDKYKEYKILK